MKKPITIPIEDCKHDYLYEIDSRNLKYGIYSEFTKGFTGIRTKFGSRYLFEEFHWDTGAPFGTVKPFREIEKCPVNRPDQSEQSNKEIFEYLEKYCV